MTHLKKQHLQHNCLSVLPRGLLLISDSEEQVPPDEMALPAVIPQPCPFHAQSKQRPNQPPVKVRCQPRQRGGSGSLLSSLEILSEFPLLGYYQPVEIGVFS